MSGIKKMPIVVLLLVLWGVIAVKHQKTDTEDPALASPTRFDAEIKPYAPSPFQFEANEEENAILALKKKQLAEEARETERLRSQRRGRSVGRDELAENGERIQQSSAEALTVSDRRMQGVKEMAEEGVLNEVLDQQTRALSSMHNPGTANGKFTPEQLKQMKQKGELIIY